MSALRAALYIRVSTAEQAREGYSLAAQERTLRALCDREGFAVHDVYADEGISGKSVTKRVAFQRMMADAEARRFDRLVIWRISRMARNMSDLCVHAERLGKHGVIIVSATEAIDNTPSGRMMFHILGAMAQMERDIIAENVRAALDERAAQELRTCGDVLGYRIVKGGDLVVDESEAVTVRRIYAQYASCRSINATAAWCREQGIRGRRGGEMGSESVRQILTRPIYIGQYSYKGQTYPGDFPSIIDREAYDAVQRTMASRARSPAS